MNLSPLRGVTCHGRWEAHTHPLPSSHRPVAIQYACALPALCGALPSSAGAGESGKSTVFKQMKLIYGVGFSDEEKVLFTHVVHNNIIASMRNLVQACEDFGYTTSCPVRAAPLVLWQCVWCVHDAMPSSAHMLCTRVHPIPRPHAQAPAPVFVVRNPPTCMLPSPYPCACGG